MSSVNQLIALAEYDRQSKEASLPMFAFARGVEQGIIEDRERRKHLEDTNTGFARLMQVINGQEDDYQNKYKVIPTVDKSGGLGMKIDQKTEDERFSEAFMAGVPEEELRMQFPLKTNAIDELKFAGHFQGTPIQAQAGTAIQPQAGTAIPSANSVPAGYVSVPKTDKFGRVVGQDIVKDLGPEIQQKEEKNVRQEQMVKDSAQRTISTIGELKKGLKYFGAMGDVPAWPAEYDKKKWVANYNTLKDKLVVDLMLRLKEASATGSTGFGQLSEKEGMRLENAATALQKGLKEEDALQYLNEIEDGAKKILGGDVGGGQAQGGQAVNSDDFSYLWQ